MNWNDTVRLIGIICIIYGIQGITFPLLKAIGGNQIVFDFFSCNSPTAFIIYLCFAAAGILLLVFTRPFSKRKRQ